MSYKKLEIWQEARELSIKIHELSLGLPKFEQYEEVQQIRRSINFLRAIEDSHNEFGSHVQESDTEYHSTEPPIQNPASRIQNPA